MSIDTNSQNGSASTASSRDREQLHQRIKDLSQVVQQYSDPFNQLMDEVGNVIVGQRKLIHRMLVGLLANGHILIEGVPG